MPRNINGIYTLPEPSFVAGTIIQSSPVNSDFSDIATALTQSLATTGVSTMTGPIKAASGAQNAPSYTFGSSLGTGWYLSAADQISWVANGAVGATFFANLNVTWAGTHTFSSVVANNNVQGNTLTITTSGTIATHPITNFPVGTFCLFAQTAAPVGWTKVTTLNDYALRLVSGAASFGGSVDFSTLFGRTAVDTHALSSNEIASHQHFMFNADPVNAQVGPIVTTTQFASGNGIQPGGNNNQYLITGTSTAATLGVTSATGGGAAHTHNIDMRVKFLDVILAQKA